MQYTGMRHHIQDMLKLPMCPVDNVSSSFTPLTLILITFTFTHFLISLTFTLTLDASYATYVLSLLQC
jgi:hypothetical protein